MGIECRSLDSIKQISRNRGQRSGKRQTGGMNDENRYRSEVVRGGGFHSSRMQKLTSFSSRESETTVEKVNTALVDGCFVPFLNIVGKIWVDPTLIRKHSSF